ncbi:condensation domain-containing protein, partial [Bacteroides ovatus]|uniref:condensation domain-containing protein n=1 Tax=Bacteroides ovatus TaxID=28116 RepID=UPI00216B5206
LRILSMYHDILRAKYGKENGIYIQHYTLDIFETDIPVIDISKHSSQELEDILSNLQSDFEIQEGRLWKSAYLHGYPDGSSRIFFAAHHLIIDAVSWRIIKDHLRHIYEYLYNIKSEGGNIHAVLPEDVLGEKRTSYRQWVSEIGRYGELNFTEVDYWKEQIKGVSQWNKLLQDMFVGESNTCRFSIDRELTDSLLHEVNLVYNTEVNDLLLSALNISLARFTGHDENYVTLEGHGREEISEDLDIANTVGWFTTMYPVRLVSGKKDNWSDTIISVKDSLRLVPNKGFGYGVLFGYLSPELPLVSFNYLGQFDKHESNMEEWGFENGSSGRMVGEGNSDPTILNINCMVIEGHLHFSVSGRLPQEYVSRFSASYKESLSNL